MSYRTYNRGEGWSPDRISRLTRDAGIVLIGGIILGLFATVASAYSVVAVVVTAALITIVVWRFETTLLIYVLIAFIPLGESPSVAVGGSGVGKGLNISETMLAFLLCVWLVRYLLLTLPMDRLRSGFHVPILLYLLYSVLNVIHSFIFWDAHVNRNYQYPQVNAAELALRVLSAGAFVMVATTVSSAKWVKWITYAALAAGVYNLLINLAPGDVTRLAAPRWAFLVLLPACYGWAMVLSPEKRWWLRLAGFAVTALSIFVILVQGVSWISGWLGLFVALGAVTFVKNRNVFVAALAVIALAAFIAWPFIQTEVIAGSQKEGDYDRFALFAGAWKYATNFPLGVGIGNYRSYNSFYYGDEWGTKSYTSAHGTYSQHLSEMGIPGTVLLISILVGGCMWLIRSYRELPPGLSKTYLLATIGQLVGVSVASTIGDYIIPTYHNGGIGCFSGSVYSWLFWGLAVAHVRIARSEQAKATAEPEPPDVDAIPASPPIDALPGGRD